MPIAAALTTVAVTGLVFLVLDVLMLRGVLQPLFQRHLGAALYDGFRLAPAAGFYLLYMAGVFWFVTGPALKSGGAVLLPAAFLGLLCYGTYELTSHAVMRDWSWQMVAVDMAWGTVLTGVSAWAGVAVTRALGLAPAAV